MQPTSSANEAARKRVTISSKLRRTGIVFAIFHISPPRRIHISSFPRVAYPFSEIEQKWQDAWRAGGVYRVRRDESRPKYYVMDMFAYPSGEGLHMGHPLSYTAVDVMMRLKRMQGFNTLRPTGWGAFGLPAEQYAVKNKLHPRITTQRNIANFKRQLESLGYGYDWSREINTTDPNYFKWTQWIFLKYYNSYFDSIEQKAKPIEELVRYI